MTQPDTAPPNFTGAAILLDRDGVINHDPGDYTKSRAEFHILPTALEAMKAWYDVRAAHAATVRVADASTVGLANAAAELLR